MPKLAAIGVPIAFRPHYLTGVALYTYLSICKGYYCGHPRSSPWNPSDGCRSRAGGTCP